MPLYDYKCINDKCCKLGLVIEVKKSILAPKPACLACDEEMQTVHSKALGVHFKGDAWTSKGGSY
jgi:predicted nucleic acid-binding Zn ribbon protein